MAYTYSKISSVTVGSGGSSSIDFIAIPQNYTDLVIKISARSSRANVQDYVAIQFNTDSLDTYTYRRLFGTGSATGGDNDTVNVTGYQTGNSATASTFSNGEIYIPNYTSAIRKSMSSDMVSENNATAANQSLTATLSANTLPVYSIKLTCAPGNTFLQYTIATLYGIKAEV